MGTRYAITGATGLLGNNLVRTLRDAGHSVRVLARAASDAQARARPELADLADDVEIVGGDLDDADGLRAVLRHAEVVIHAAADVYIGHARRAAMERVNVEGTRAVCAATPASARLVHVSTVDALGLGPEGAPADEDTPPRPEEGGVPYVDTKRAADAVVRASGVEHVIVHPTLMFGPWDWKPSSGRMLLAVARGAARLAPDGGNNFVHVADVVAGTVAAARGPSGRAWILGNTNLTYRDAWTRMAAITGAPAPLLTIPRAAGRVAAGALDAVRRAGLPEREVNGASVRMGFLPHYFDPARARVELGLPATPVEAAFRDAWDWFRARGMA